MLSNAVFLESGYHTFFPELSDLFSSSLFVSSTRSHRFFFSQRRGVIFSPHAVSIDRASDEEIELAFMVQKFGFVRGSNAKSVSFEYILGSVRFAFDLLSDFSADLLIMHNHQRFMHSVFSIVAKRIGIRVIVFERGLFRPFTTTIDVGGVNSEASAKEQWSARDCISRANNWSYDQMNGFDRLGTRLRFLTFYFLLLLECTFGVSAGAYLPKKPSQLFNVVFSKIKNKIGFNRYPSVSTEGAFVLFPLQLASDTQILLNSPWNSVMHLLFHVNKKLEEAALTDIKFICTVHPLDDAVYFDFPNLKFTRERTASLVSKACGVLTVNSTVSIEALKQSVPICLLGESGFNVPDVGYFERLDQFLTFVASGDRIPDYQHDLRSKYLDFLKYQYQTPINVYDFSSVDVNTAYRKICSLVM